MRITSVLLLATVAVIGARGGQARADEIGGPWRVEGKFAGIAFTLDCNFRPDGMKLGGVCVESSVNGAKAGKSHVLTGGSLSGNKVSWTYTAQYLVTRFNVTFIGLRNGNRMTGTIDLKGHEGSFTATRM